MPIGAGDRLNGYAVLRLLGTGGMGEVWLARDLKLQRQVALKVLPPGLTQDPSRVARFQQEARAASALNHPNVCTIHGLGETPDGQQFIAMEYVEGETLRHRLKGRHLTLREALDIAIQIASALTAAHAAGVVHRDLKPENVMLRPDGFIKLLDFGLAKLVFPSSSDATAYTTAAVRTDAGTVVGTVDYMSPEQARAQDVDSRTDVWSLGVMIYEMVAGRCPFTGQSSSDVLASILDREPTTLARFDPDAPAELQRMVTKALRKDREQRYQGMKDLLLDLQALRDDVAEQARSSRADGGLADQLAGPLGTPTPPLASNSATPRTQSSAEYVVTRLARPKVAAAFIACVLVLMAGGWWWAVRDRHTGNDIVRSAAPVRRNLTRLTFDPGLQGEPTWSPDGRSIAYSSDRDGNFDIWVQSGVESKPVRVTTSPAHDWQPNWSPDGERIVFRSEREGGGLFVVPALGGNERKVSGFGYRPQWSRDGSQILFYSLILEATFEPTNVHVVAMDGKPPKAVLPGFLTQFTFPFLRAAWHPDGRRISIWGRHRDAGWSLWTAPLSGGTPVKSEYSAEVQRELKDASVDFSDFLWAPSGNALYFVGSSLGVTNLWRVEVDPQSLRWVAGPERLTTGAGLDTDIALSLDGTKLAFATRSQHTQIWWLPFDAATGQTRGPGQPLTAGGADAVMPALTSDGKKLVFVTQRAGREELWAKSLDDGRENLLAAYDGLWRRLPRWSRDGQRLAYRRSRPTSPESELSIVLLPAGGGEEQVLTSPGLARESALDWSADGEWILGNSTRRTPGRTLICLFPIAAAPHAETQMRVVAADPEQSLFQARFSADERWIVFNAIKATDAGSSTIYVVPRSGGAWTQITEGKHWDDKPRWSPDGKTLYFVSNRTGFFNVWGIRFDPTRGTPTGEAFRVTTFESPSRTVLPIPALMELSLSAHRLVLPIMEVSGSIWILTNVDR